MVEAAIRCPSRRSSPLDPDHAPPGILPRQAQDQRDKLIRNGRASRRPGLAPLRRHQPPVPAQQRAGRHDPPGPQPFRHDPCKSGEHGPVGPGHARSGVGPAQYGHLVPQREYLHILCRRRPGQQRQPGQHGHQQPVSQHDKHGCRSCRHQNPRSNQRPSIRPLQDGIFGRRKVSKLCPALESHTGPPASASANTPGVRIWLREIRDTESTDNDHCLARGHA
jgi:hypothetical protein